MWPRVIHVREIAPHFLHPVKCRCALDSRLCVVWYGSFLYGLQYTIIPGGVYWTFPARQHRGECNSPTDSIPGMESSNASLLPCRQYNCTALRVSFALATEVYREERTDVRPIMPTPACIRKWTRRSRLSCSPLWRPQCLHCTWLCSNQYVRRKGWLRLRYLAFRMFCCILRSHATFSRYDIYSTLLLCQ